MEFKPTVCIYHANCMDGFTAAYQVWRHFPNRDTLRFVGATHGDAPPYHVIQKTDDVIVVDFTYPEKAMRELARRSNRVLVLDHHKTAEEALSRFNAVVRPTAATVHQDFELIERHGEDDTVPKNLLVQFDMDRSGAMLAWDFCFPDNARPMLVELVQDRDLWRFDYPETEAVHLYLTTCPMTFQHWKIVEALLEDSDEVEESGARILNYHKLLVRKIVDTTGGIRKFFTFDKVAVGVAPHMLASDVGHALLNRFPEAEFAAIMVVEKDGVTWSLRSEDGRRDVSEVAKLFGGGGHRNAAGFRADA